MPTETNTGNNTYVSPELRDNVVGAPSIPPQEEILGDLGQRYKSPDALVLEARALRENASTLTYGKHYNHRFQGPRESVKFNFSIQAALLKNANLYSSMKDIDASFTGTSTVTILVDFAFYPTEETNNNTDPTDSEIALFYHIRCQQLFHEWMLLKDSNILWFN